MISYRVNWWQLALGGLLWSAFYTLMLQEVFDLSWHRSIIESLGTNFVLMLSLVTAMNGLRYYQPSHDRFVFLVTAASILSVAVVILDRYVVTYFFQGEDYLDYFEKSLFFHGGFAFLANAAAIELSMQWNQIKEQHEIQQRKEETELMVKEAELLKLRHQLQPHFLFNSLNSINALITAEPQQARKMVQQLSAFLRGTIRADENKTISLLKEMEYIDLYLQIEKVRFGHRLQTEINIEDAAMSMELPPLLLQPLMENAIKFGLYGTTGDVLIRLRAKAQNRMLELEISNPIDSDVETQSGTGFGLNSIKRRLNLIFGRNDLLTTSKTETEFTALLKIPQP